MHDELDLFFKVMVWYAMYLYNQRVDFLKLALIYHSDTLYDLGPIFRVIIY